jgi:predicted PurR-regulated permease PerM
LREVTVQSASLREDLARKTLAIFFIAALLVICLWIMQPFLPATVWAATLAIATWSIMRRLQARLWNKRGLAVMVMSLALLLIFVVPFWLAIGTIVANADAIMHWGEMAATVDVPPPPGWVGDIPLVGERITLGWQRIADSEAQDLLQRIRPYTGMLVTWFAGAVGSFGKVLLQFLLTVAIAALFYARGEQAAAYAKRFGSRLAGDRGEQAVVLAGQAIRGVALGVVVTAFVQAAISSAALFATGVPYAAVLSALCFMLCIAQLGPALVLIPAVIWMYWSGAAIPATILLVCTVIAQAMDNVLRPVLIRRGVDLPLLLILVGVIGGLVAFGLIGIFLGPMVLAVGYTLLDAWVAETSEPDGSRKAE